MDEGAFDQNFTWYEWGFVSPSEVPSEDLAVPTNRVRWPFHEFEAQGTWLRTQSFRDDRQWPT
jgi:hypothetical protein